MENYNLNLESDFTNVQEINTEGYRSTLYEKNEDFSIMGENSRLIIEITENNVALIRCFVFSDNAKSSRTFAEKLYGKLVENYYKPDTSTALNDRISNHIQLSEDELYQYPFSYQDQWILPPAFNEYVSLLRMEYSYLPENDLENGKYRVMIVIQRSMLELHLNTADKEF